MEQDDHWMAIDFVALRHLIGARDNHSEWLCRTTIRTNRGFFLGDPACDRIVFNPPPFETVFSGPPRILALKYLFAVNKASSLLSAGDTLVLVLVGHGDADNQHSFFVGDNSNSYYQLAKNDLEEAVHATKGHILLISTACFSGSWKSQYWTLLAAAKAEQEAPSIVESGSNEFRGGFFTNSLLAEYADEFKIRPPYPGSVDETGQRAEQKEHDFGPTNAIHPSPCLPKRSLQAILNWMHRFRDDIGRTYMSADMVFDPCSNEPHKLPFVSLISATEPFHRLTCIPPSLPDDSSSSHSTACCPAILSPPPQNTLELSVTWSASEEAELVALAADFLLYMPPTITSERGPIILCRTVMFDQKHSCETLSLAMKRNLLSQLKKRECHRKLALAIAMNLGWEKAVQDIGGPGGKQRQLGTRLDLRRQAEVNRCLVSMLLIPEKAQWAGAAGWLARIWEAAGCPIVFPNEWKMAIEQSQVA
ncbi:hypothetical protein L208DRAFT_1292530 [Tricholoma matsutake]|nr:hypothetical protein L208DRAFT_1292530 [Tricholoma matsutake 945]